MNEIKELFIINLFLLGFVGATLQLFRGYKKQDTWKIFVGLLYIIPAMVNFFALALDFRLGNWSAYLFFIPLFILILSYIQSYSKVIKYLGLALGVFLILNFMTNFSKLHEGQHTIDLMRAKSDFISLDPLVMNIVFEEQFPYLKDIATYYSSKSKGDHTAIFDRPMTQQDLQGVDQLQHLYSHIRIIYNIDDSREEDALVHITNKLQEHFYISNVDFQKVSVSDYWSYQKKKYTFKILTFSKKIGN